MPKPSIKKREVVKYVLRLDPLCDSVLNDVCDKSKVSKNALIEAILCRYFSVSLPVERVVSGLLLSDGEVSRV